MAKKLNRATDLIAGLEEALDHARGKIKLRTNKISIMDLPSYNCQDFIRIRDKAGLRQTSLAFSFGVSLRTVQYWEEGTKKPNGAALRLYQMLDKNANFLEEQGLRA